MARAAPARCCRLRSALRRGRRDTRTRLPSAWCRGRSEDAGRDDSACRCGPTRRTSAGAPPNGSFVQVAGSPQIYEIAGGAPLYVSSWGDVGGSHPYSVISQQEFDGLNAVPSNGTFIRDAGSGGIWEVAGGAPLYVSSCANLGGCAGAVNVDLWDVQNAGNPMAHLNQVPSNGTFLRDPAGYTIWEVAGGAPLVVSSCANLGGCPAR